MTNGVLVSFLVPCKLVSMVKHRVLLSMTRLVLDLSSPTPNARLVHVEIDEGRPFQGCVFGGVLTGTELTAYALCTSMMKEEASLLGVLLRGPKPYRSLP